MCGRFTQQRPTAELAELFEARPAPEGATGHYDDPGGHYNVAPTQDVAVIVQPAPDRARVVDAYRWGLVPSWAKDPKIGNRMINARAETVATSPAFKRSFSAGRRCIVPADAFYEWRRVDEKTRQPYLIRRPDGAPLAFAGLWSTWKDEPNEAWLRSCTIITTRANEGMERIHDRMPVILPPEVWDQWLDPSLTDTELLQALLHATPAGELEAVPISTAVNNPRNKGPELARPVEGEVLTV
ncbi:MAG TPA: SOS response-associated peptidase [Candidatus Dormibacteraeota bacterium]|nr:SOS response-associated peptidase [Candidatus Dormibacteraeota bacterium]